MAIRCQLKCLFNKLIPINQLALFRGGEVSTFDCYVTLTTLTLLQREHHKIIYGSDIPLLSQWYYSFENKRNLLEAHAQVN